MCTLGVHLGFQGYTESPRLSPCQHNALPGYIRQPWPSPCSLWAQSYFPPQWIEIWPCSIAVLFTLLIIFWATQCFPFDNCPFVCLNFILWSLPMVLGSLRDGAHNTFLQSPDVTLWKGPRSCMFEFCWCVHSGLLLVGHCSFQCCEDFHCYFILRGLKT